MNERDAWEMFHEAARDHDRLRLALALTHLRLVEFINGMCKR